MRGETIRIPLQPLSYLQIEERARLQRERDELRCQVRALGKEAQSFGETFAARTDETSSDRKRNQKEAVESHEEWEYLTPQVSEVEG